MAKRDTVEESLSKLQQLRGKPATAEARELLATGLKSKVNLIAARAAKIAAELQLADLSPDLETAFARFMINPGATDKQCAAKLAIANALYELDASPAAVFLSGVHHVQMEPVFGGSADSAVELRGRCAWGLVKIGYRQIMTVLTDLLADADPQARIAAARAIAAVNRDEGALLLRLKIHLGDEKPEVTGECLTAIMAIAPKGSIEFVTDYLDDPDEIISQSAALAMGQSRLPEALAILIDHYNKTVGPDRNGWLLPIAMTRLPDAVTFLLNQASGDRKQAGAVLSAMSIYRHDENIVSQLQAIIAKHGDEALNKTFQAIFQPSFPNARPSP